VKLITRASSPEGDIISVWDSGTITNRRRAAIIVEDAILNAFKVWLAKINWTSPQAVKTRTGRSTPQFGQFRFDLVGPSYLNSIIHFKRERKINGFIIGDILLDKDISVEELEPFLSKWAVLTQQRRATRFQPIFIADSFSPEALRALRSRGAIVARPETIFGFEAAKELRELVGTIENAAAALTNHPTAVFELLRKISKIEGTASHLRGVVVELIVAHLFQLRGYKIDIRQQIQAMDGELAEIDVKAVNRQEVVCVECKGKSPGNLVGKPEIDTWLTTSLPRIKSWFGRQPNLPEQKRFEFYSATDYTPEANSFIAEVTASHKRQPLAFYNGTQILSQLGDQKEGSLVKIFQEQFDTT
jgi:hypothetical protein